MHYLIGNKKHIRSIIVKIDMSSQTYNGTKKKSIRVTEPCNVIERPYIRYLSITNMQHQLRMS